MIGLFKKDSRYQAHKKAVTYWRRLILRSDRIVDAHEEPGRCCFVVESRKGGDIHRKIYRYQP